MYVPEVTTQEHILGMGLVAIGQRNVYPGGAEYGELGLSVVVRTSRDESGTELVWRFATLLWKWQTNPVDEGSFRNQDDECDQGGLLF